MALMVCELMLAFDHLRHEVTVLGYAFCESEDAASVAYDHAVELIDEARAALRGPVPPPPERPARAASVEPRPARSRPRASTARGART